MQRGQWMLLAGDVILLVVLAIIGFLSHGQSPLTPRLLVTFGSFLLAWLWVAVPLGLFYLPEPNHVGRWVARIVWAWSLAAPLGALIRAWWLGRMAPLPFVLVTFGLYALTFAIWRALVSLRWNRRQALMPR